MKTWITVLSILGGLSGAFSGLMVGMAGGLSGNGNMAESGGWVFYLSFLAIALAFTSRKWTNISGWLLIALSVFGLIMNGWFFVIAFIILLIAGILAIRSGKVQNKTVAA